MRKLGHGQALVPLLYKKPIGLSGHWLDQIFVNMLDLWTSHDG